MLHYIVIKLVDTPVHNCDIGVPLLYKAGRPRDDHVIFCLTSFKLFEYQTAQVRGSTVLFIVTSVGTTNLKELQGFELKRNNKNRAIILDNAHFVRYISYKRYLEIGSTSALWLTDFIKQSMEIYTRHSEYPYMKLLMILDVCKYEIC
jgi:hypothetical protein